MDEFLNIFRRIKEDTGCDANHAVIAAGLVMLCNREIPDPPATVIEDTPPPQPPEAVNLDMLRDVVSEKAKKGLKDQLRAVLAQFNATKLTDIPSEKYSALYERLVTL